MTRRHPQSSRFRSLELDAAWTSTQLELAAIAHGLRAATARSAST